MKVETEFEVKHFVKYINDNLLPVTINVRDYKESFYIADVNGEDFKIYSNILDTVQIKCPRLTIKYKLVQ